MKLGLLLAALLGLIGGSASAALHQAPLERLTQDGSGAKTQPGQRGPGQPFITRYDFANRLTRTVDAAGREELRTWSRAHNLLSLTKRMGNSTHLTQATTWDGLDRPLEVTEVVTRSAGLTSASFSYTVRHAYDDVNHRASTRDRRGFVSTRELDDLDRVIREVTDDAAGVLLRTPDDVRAGSTGLSLATRYVHDANGNVLTRVDPLGRSTSATYDALNRLVAQALPMGVTEVSVFDGEGNRVAHTDGRLITRKSRFDMLGRPTKTVLVESISNGSAELTVRQATYNDGAGGLTERTEKDANGNESHHFEDGLHREVKSTDALGHSAEVTFDAVVRKATRDRRGFIARFSYDAVNRLLSTREFEPGMAAARYSQSTTYDDAQRTTSSLDRRSIQSVQHFDGLGRLEKTTRGVEPLRQTEVTHRDGAGNAVKLTDANGHVAESVFDGAGRLLESTRGLGTVDAATTRHKYDAVGNRVETKGARGPWSYDVRETYDDLNRPTRSEDALQNVTSRAFDAAGNKLCEKRPLGGAPFAHGAASGKTVAELQAEVCTGSQLTRFSYDETGALLSVTDALGGGWTYLYDANRNLVAKQDANLQLTTYENDSLNRRTAEHQQLGAHARLTVGQRSSVPLNLGAPNLVAQTGTLTWIRTYDESSNVRTTTDPKGQVATSVWGMLNRLGSVDYTHASPRELPSLDGIDYSYNENGNVLDITERKTTSSGSNVELTLRTYDGLDRLKTETRYDGKVLGYDYDLKGNRTQVTDSSSVATDYTFDALDRLKTATFGGSTTNYTYWPDSLAKSVAFPLPNGIHEGRCYDAAGRLTSLLTAKGLISDTCATSAALVSRYDYGFDFNGNRTSQLEQRTDVATQTLGLPEATQYGFDEDDRLVAVRYPDAGALYRLDAVGNRTGERRAPASKMPLLLTVAAFAAMAPADLTHDITGAFNRADWLMNQVDAKDPSRNVALSYDVNGNVTQKATAALTRSYKWDCRDTLTAVLDNGVAVGRYDYDRNLQRVKRTAGAERVEYVLDDKYVLQEADGSLSGHPTTRRYHYAAQPFAVTTGGVTSYLNVDALGSVTDATSTSGAVTSARQYDAWGQYRNNTAPTPAEPKLGYTGHQFDVETSLVYARARYYDPALGIFLSRDSVEGSLNDAPSLHRYAYTRGNPTRWIDFLGLDPWEVQQQIQRNIARVKGIDQRKIDLSGRTAESAYPLTGANAFVAGYASTPAKTIEGVANQPLLTTLGQINKATETIFNPGKWGEAAVSTVVEIGSGWIDTYQHIGKGEHFEAGETAPIVSTAAAIEGAASLGEAALAKQVVAPGGTAVVRRYMNREGGHHFSVEVEGPGIPAKETHQVWTEPTGKTTQVFEVDAQDLKRLRQVDERKFDLRNPAEARATQDAQLAQGETGQWNKTGPAANSCTTVVCQVLNAGGLEGAPAAAARAQEFVYELFGIKR